MVEIVWNADRAATCSPPSGAGVPVGSGTAWTAADLLAAAVATSVMETFFESAAEARVPILEYTSSSRLRTSGPAKAGVELQLRITVPPGVPPDVVSALSRHARRTAPLARALATTVAVSSEVEVVTPVPA